MFKSSVTSFQRQQISTSPGSSSIIFVLMFNPACDVKGRHLVNICSVFIWQHNTSLSRLCLQCKNNSGLFTVYTWRYTRALAEQYFCISQSGISGITRVLTSTTEMRTAENLGGGTELKCSIPAKKKKPCC